MEAMAGMRSVAVPGGPDGVPQSKMLLDVLRKLYKKNVELVKENQMVRQELEQSKRKVVALEREAASARDAAGDVPGPVARRSVAKPKATQGVTNASNGVGGSGARTRSVKASRDPAASDGPSQRGGQTVGPTQLHARKLMNELSSRLTEEKKQRDVEAAVYNAQLYEYEKKEVDWYVEKKYLEDRIVSLEQEVAKRNALDEQIEGCIQLLCEKVTVGGAKAVR